MISHALAKCVEPRVLEELISYAGVAGPGTMLRLQLVPDGTEGYADCVTKPTFPIDALRNTRQP
jgi:hypothetical protein